MAGLDSINFVVHLMLENRSFDQMLGFLYPGQRTPDGQPFEGLTGDEFNLDDTGRQVKVFPITAASPNPYLMPGADPGEGFQKTNYQLFSTDDPPDGAVATNSGFVKSFKAAIAYDQSKHYKDSLPGTNASQIMGMYSPEMLPILTGLAKGYAVCDHWFASVPTETLPNRSFAAAATSQGHLDDTVHSFTCPSIFGSLTTKGLDWGIYGYNRDPLTRLDYNDTKEADESHFGHFRDFEARCQAGTLPPYTFLEPDFSSTGNSQHPNYDVSLGEQLIHDVYYALRNGPGWKKTLLIISYDEHGGNFDHVPPPATATAPDHSVGDYGFKFNRFGVRVPAVLISPLIAQGTVFRAAHGVIDHTSVLKTIEQRWDVPSLTQRDKAAPSLGPVLTLARPRADDPIAGVLVPASEQTHPNSSQPSYLESLHAAKVSTLAIRNDKGSYDRSSMPAFDSSAQVGRYIQNQTAAWTQHLQRRRRRP